MNEGDGARYACEDRVARRAGVGFVLRYPELVCTKLRARLEGGSVLTLLSIPCLGSAADAGAAFCARQVTWTDGLNMS